MTRVLIVDDKAENLYLLRALLSGHDCTVDEARHGAEALVRGRQSPPDLIISDLLMPVMDGFALLRQWKADDRLQRIPFIVYTAFYTAPTHEKLALDLGADAFILKPADPELFLARIREVLGRSEAGQPGPGRPPAAEETVLLKELVTHASPLRDATGAVTALLGVTRDNTQRKRVEDLLRLQGAALGAAARGMAITDLDGTIVWVNAAFSTDTGYGLEEAIDRNLWALDRSSVPDQAFYHELWATVSAGRVWQGEMTSRRKDGSLYPEEQTITPVKTAGGEISHFIAINRDLTREKTIQAQLLQARRMEAVGRLTEGLAHDFNNILMAILCYADFLVDGLTWSPGLVDDAREIRKAAERAATLNRQLLAFSRKQVLVPQALDLNQVISELVKLLRRLLGEDIQILTKLAPDLGTVHADPGQIEQVIMNLALNARDAMPTGGPLEIRTTNAELDAAYTRAHRYVTPGPYVALWVTDRGTGIPKDILPRLFEPYFTTKELGKGTGLGLATVYGIVKQSGGHVEVYSELGLGSTFKVYLPRRDEPLVPLVEAPLVEPKGGHETVLVVDDDTVVGGLVARILAEHGYQVLLATHPSNAADIARRHAGPIDLLLTDVVMPEHSGKEVAAELSTQRPEIKVLYMSGFTGEAIAHRELVEPGPLLLTKPVSASTLLRVVRAVLDGTTEAGA